jgi:1,4-alpha-glucan branching enzyme
MKTTNSCGKLFVFFLALFIGGVIWLFNQAEDYYTYASDTVEGARAVAPLNKEDMLAHVSPAPVAYDTVVKYRKFFITAPGAKQVELRADFNRWGKDPIVLTPYKRGYFETSVALAGGEYKYTFVVDGKDTPDPSNQDRHTLADGREICIKTVR